MPCSDVDSLRSLNEEEAGTSCASSIITSDDVPKLSDAKSLVAAVEVAERAILLHKAKPELMETPPNAITVENFRTNNKQKMGTPPTPTANTTRKLGEFRRSMHVTDQFFKEVGKDKIVLIYAYFTL